MGLASSQLVARAGGYTIAQAFTELVEDLQIEHYKPIASAQQDRLRKRLEGHLEVQDSYLTGSYRRNTQIRPLDDIDLLLVLKPEEYASIAGDSWTGPTAALNLVEDALRKVYPTTEIHRFDRCLRLQFDGTGIGFDVIPAFRDGDDVFLIPDEAEPAWIPTNPKEHERLVSAANERLSGMLVPLVKLMKAACGTKALDTGLAGFHVEMMVYYALQHVPATYRDGVAFLLDDLSRRVYSPVPDPWSRGRNADEKLAFDVRMAAADRLRRAADRANDAIAAERRGDVDAAHAAWADVFGEWYPAKPEAKAKRLSVSDTVAVVRSTSRISATSSGLVALTPGLASAISPTSHGGRTAPHRSYEWSGVDPDRAWHERQISRVLRQFPALRRLSPVEAAADPTIPQVTIDDVSRLYAVLVGDQHTNFGTRHRLLIVIPKDAPRIEPAIYDLKPYQPSRITASGWRPRRSLVHRWRGGVLCTHAGRDRWDGELVTLVIWAVDWLFRQEYRQRFGQWLGVELRQDRVLRNGVFVERAPIGRKRGPHRGRS